MNNKFMTYFINIISVMLLLFVIAASPLSAKNFNKAAYVSTNKTGGSFTLSSSGKSAALYASSKDFPGVIRVIKLLQKDISNVTNAKPELSMDVVPEAKEIVIVGTLGKNPVIDKLAADKKIDVKDIKGKWETFLIQVIEKPFPNVERALVIAGSDKRGTIYGMFDLTAQIGVSPWYWWADVPVKKQPELFVLPGRFSDGEPKVKYRGIFINDEAPALAGWSQKKYGTVQFNHKLYEHVFELILRLKGNFLWPAMWGRSFFDDDSLNDKLADEYGVVISTSHHEPLMRAHVEWQRYGNGPWNYEKNDKTLREFWRKGIERMGNKEGVITLAMRGDGDEAMSPDANVELLERIVKDQRKIIADVTKKDAAAVPQVWALYKEVQEYYDKGMRVPDDVTVLLCDDNWGNIRKLPKLNEKPRKGGYGIYYHFDFVGGPRNYKWVNTNQIERVWEQMRLAYEYNARQIWIVNVGDIKPFEFPIEFFLDYAWNPENYTAENLPEYTRLWAEQQFGKTYAGEIAEILEGYTKYNSRRKPEMLSPATYSLVEYKEAETVVSEYNKLADKAERIYNALPYEYKDAFFQLVLHPTKASANLNELYVTVGKNYLYANQGRATANSLAEKAKALYLQDSLISLHYNKVMANGKWDHMMDQTHIGYTSWQEPRFQVMPKVKTIELPGKAEMGVAIEGSDKWWPNESSQPVLPELDVYNQQNYYIDIFNRGTEAFDFSIQTAEPWLQINDKFGEVETEKRIWVSVDWKNAPSGKRRVPVTISGPENTSVIVYAEINNPELPKRDQVNGFIESNGYVSIEAENYSKAVEKDGLSWLKIPNLGRTGSAMTPMPLTAKAQTPGGDSPRLEYQIYFFNEGEVKVDLYFSPTLNFVGSSVDNSGQGLYYAVSIDDEAPQIINMNQGENIPDWKYPRWWNEAVGNNIRIISSKHTIKKAGEHVLKFWMVNPAVVLQKIVVSTKELKPGYLGPAQSYFRLGKNAEAKK